jgi:hypothetical protein
MDFASIWNSLSYTDGLLFSVWLGGLYWGKVWIDYRFRRKERSDY